MTHQAGFVKLNDFQLERIRVNNSTLLLYDFGDLLLHIRVHFLRDICLFGENICQQTIEQRNVVCH